MPWNYGMPSAAPPLPPLFVAGGTRQYYTPKREAEVTSIRINYHYGFQSYQYGFISWIALVCFAFYLSLPPSLFRAV